LSESTRSPVTPAGSEPVHGVAQDADRGCGGLVVVDLGVGHAAVVVDDGVHERGAHQRIAVLVAQFV
jgi:hypothetical protein